MAYPEDYPDDLTKAKAQGYLRKHMVVRADPATGLPIGGGALPGDDLAIARAQGYLNRHMVVLADPATGLPVGGGAMAGDDLAWAKSQGTLYHHMTLDADPTTGLPVGGGSLPGDDLAEARRNGYLHRHMVVLVDPATGLPVGGGALPGDDLTIAKAQGYLHRHMILDTDPVTGLPVPPVTAYVANGVDFNEATPDYLTRATDLVGNADSYTGTFSFWFRRDGAGTADTILCNDTGIGIRVRFTPTTSFFNIILQNGALIFQFTSTGTYPASANWRWIGASWNLNAAAGLKVIHVWNDTGIVAGGTADTDPAFMADYTRVGWGVASQFPAANPFNGCISELFFAPGQFIDLSVASNRAKFISDAGAPRQPVSLGADGSTPLGAVPLVYLKNPAATAHINSGSGGNFTIVGAPAVASTPVQSAYVANAVDFNEVTPDWLTRISDLNGNADSYTGTFSCWFRRDSAATTDTIIGNEGNVVRIRLQTTNTLNVYLSNAGLALQFDTTKTWTADGLWHWIGLSWNTNFAAGLKVIHVYDEAGALAGTKTDAAAAFQIDYTRLGWSVASAPTGNPFNGCLAELFFAPGQFIDLTVQANREKFILGGKPVPLGADGSTPLGAVPLVYLKNPAATCNVNSGSGGDFTIVGAPAVASTAP